MPSIKLRDQARTTNLVGHAQQKWERRTKATIKNIRQAIYDVIDDDTPMTVRQVFYQLVARGIIEKTEAAYKGTVIRLMTEMRLGGDLPWDWVVDESRRVRITETYDSIADAIEKTAESALRARSMSRLRRGLVREGRSRRGHVGCDVRLRRSPDD
jgi:hypothetical protein